MDTDGPTCADKHGPMNTDGPTRRRCLCDENFRHTCSVMGHTVVSSQKTENFSTHDRGLCDD